MRAKEILNQVLVLNNVEQQGKAISGMFETFREFVDRWFGESTNIIVGGYKNNTEYFYSYGEPLKGVADIILEDDGSKIYLYEME